LTVGEPLRLDEGEVVPEILGASRLIRIEADWPAEIEKLFGTPAKNRPRYPLGFRPGAG
jgi:hypothetical protein